VQYYAFQLSHYGEGDTVKMDEFTAAVLLKDHTIELIEKKEEPKEETKEKVKEVIVKKGKVSKKGK